MLNLLIEANFSKIEKVVLAAVKELEPERQITRAIVQGRLACDLTQKELAEVTRINQADIRRLESGTANPSPSTRKRLAAGMHMKLEVCFVQTR